MKLLHSVFYHASIGFPEAVPAGIIAVDLGSDVELSDCPKEIAHTCTSVGLFDDTSMLLGFTNEDADLVRGPADDKHFHYCVHDQLVPDYQWEAIKSLNNFRIHEIPYDEVITLMKDFIYRYE